MILDLQYEEEYNRKYPVVCVDEKNCQLLKEVREPIASKEGKHFLKREFINEQLRVNTE